jgi:hypothetical protein
MKKHIYILLLLALCLVFSASANSLPPTDPLQSIQEEINSGRELNESYQKAKEKATNAANDYLKNPTDANHDKFVEARRRQIDAAHKLIDNRTKVINDVIAHFGLTIPPGQVIKYDINCRGECVHGYCSIKCPIGLCEKAFNPQPWGGGGTPAWIAAIIKHELEHKKQINPGPPPNWTKTKAEREYDAWQAALKCAETSGLSQIEKDKIIAIKRFWSNAITASGAEDHSLVISEWQNNAEHSLPGIYHNTTISATNYTDFPLMDTIFITNQKGWPIEPNNFLAFVYPGMAMNFPITFQIPDTAKINSKNELFCKTHIPGDTISDFTFILVDPSVTVTAGPNISAYRGETVPISFMVDNNVHATTDTIMIELTNSLNWPIFPPSYEVVLMPGEAFTFVSNLVIPPVLPYWTTNLVYCRASSIHHPIQTQQKWNSVQIIENDISALLIDTPLGNNMKGSTITPAAWAYNSGSEMSNFDFFVEIGLPAVYRDSIKGIFLPPGHDMLFFFNPLILNTLGDFNIKYYTRAMCCDANPGNDTITGMFTVTIPSQVYLQNIYIHMGEERCYEATNSITTGGPDGLFSVDGGAIVHLVAGQKINMLPSTHLSTGSYVHAFIDPTGLFCNSPLRMVEAKKDEINPESSISEVLSTKSFFRIYPNPTPGQFTLELTGLFATNELIVEIYSIMGDKILFKTLDGQLKYDLSLEGLQSGVYLMHVISGKEVGTVKIIKQ